MEVNTDNCACPIPCTASDFKYEISSAELSNNFVKNELKNGKQDPKFQDAIEKSRYQLLIHRSRISSKLRPVRGYCIAKFGHQKKTVEMLFVI